MSDAAIYHLPCQPYLLIHSSVDTGLYLAGDRDGGEAQKIRGGDAEVGAGEEESCGCH